MISFIAVDSFLREWLTLMNDSKNASIKSPDPTWWRRYFYPSLLSAKGYALDIVPDVKIKLDQNECPWDFPANLKDKILARVKETQWNRYPNPMADQLTEALARHVGVKPENILTGPGSNQLITLVLDALGHQLPGKVVIARPSFPLFESHCRYSNISYEPWELDENLDYDMRRLPALPAGSLVVFASPNNPSGSYLTPGAFEELLKSHPDTLFIADEAYAEFAGETYLPLMASYSNMLIIRTLSKTMGAAGVRLGYLIGAPDLLREIGKLRLPYLLNHFTVQAILTILEDAETKTFVARNVSNARRERDRIYESVRPLAEKGGYQIKNSKANFLLLRFGGNERAQRAYQALIGEGILVRNVMGAPGMAGCLRVSVGTEAENDAFIRAMAKV